MTITYTREAFEHAAFIVDRYGPTDAPEWVGYYRDDLALLLDQAHADALEDDGHRTVWAAHLPTCEVCK